MLGTPFSPWPCFDEEEAAAVRRVLLSNRVNYWTGTEGREFEREFAAWCGVQYAVALANGTVALELALRVLGIGPGDEVVVSPRSFFASASCVVSVGAAPVFADVDRNSQNVTADTIQSVLTPRTRAIICVHLAGWPCDMDPILRLARERDLRVIEDCAQAHGARDRDNPVGGIGDIGAWSFCQDKILTTGGEGGMLTMRDADWWQAAWSYKDHGKSWDKMTGAEHGTGFRWVHDSFGTNWRMIEMQAAIGRIQLRRLPDWHTRRVANARHIWQAAGRLPGLRVPALPRWQEHAAYKCYVFVEPRDLAPGWDRDRIQQAITEAGVPCYSGSCPELYRERAFDGTRWRPESPLPTARELGETSLMFLVHPNLTEGEIAKTCDALAAVMHRAARASARAQSA